MNHRNFFSDLKRRNVYKVGVAYAVVGCLIAQIARQIFPFPEIPNRAIRLGVSIARLKMDPVWDPIRDDPGFQQLLTVKELVGPNE